jgi:hypothetical protein
MRSSHVVRGAADVAVDRGPRVRGAPRRRIGAAAASAGITTSAVLLTRLIPRRSPFLAFEV